MSKKFEDHWHKEYRLNRETLEKQKEQIAELKELHKHQSENDQIIFQDVYKQINELKEEVGLHDRLLTHYKEHIGNLEEVLRDEFNFRVKWCAKAINMDSLEGILRPEQITHLEEQVGFYLKLLEKLDAPKETEKKEIPSENLRTCSECQKIFKSIELRKNHEFLIHGIGEFIKDSEGNEPCPICFGDKLDDLNQIEDEDKRYHAIQDFINGLLNSEGEKEEDSHSKERVDGDVSARGNNLASDSKLPEPNIPIRENGDDVLFYDPCSACKFEPTDSQDLCSKNCFVKTDGHRSAWEPKEKTEPEKFPKVVYQLGTDSKEYVELKKKYDKLIEGFIKFIDHFEGRYEGNKCGECWEYWKTIKEHYNGV